MLNRDIIRNETILNSVGSDGSSYKTFFVVCWLKLKLSYLNSKFNLRLFSLSGLNLSSSNIKEKNFNLLSRILNEKDKVIGPSLSVLSNNPINRIDLLNTYSNCAVEDENFLKFLLEVFEKENIKPCEESFRTIHKDIVDELRIGDELLEATSKNIDELYQCFYKYYFSTHANINNYLLIQKSILETIEDNSIDEKKKHNLLSYLSIFFSNMETKKMYFVLKLLENNELRTLAEEKKQYYIHNLRNYTTSFSFPSLTQISSYLNTLFHISNIELGDEVALLSIIDNLNESDFTYNSLGKRNPDYTLRKKLNLSFNNFPNIDSTNSASICEIGTQKEKGNKYILDDLYFFTSFVNKMKSEQTRILANGSTIYSFLERTDEDKYLDCKKNLKELKRCLNLGLFDSEYDSFLPATKEFLKKSFLKKLNNNVLFSTVFLELNINYDENRVSQNEIRREQNLPDFLSQNGNLDKVLDNIILENKDVESEFSSLSINEEFFRFNPNFLLRKILLKNKKEFILKYNNPFLPNDSVFKVSVIVLIILFISWICEVIFSEIKFFNFRVGINDLDILLERTIIKNSLMVNIESMLYIFISSYVKFEFFLLKFKSIKYFLTKENSLAASNLTTNICDELDMVYKINNVLQYEENLMGVERTYSLIRNSVEFDNIFTHDLTNYLKYKPNKLIDYIENPFFKFLINSQIKSVVTPTKRVTRNERISYLIKEQFINEIYLQLISLFFRSLIYFIPFYKYRKVQNVNISKIKKRLLILNK